MTADNQPFELTGREPELAGYDRDISPMLGGDRRLWPSMSVHLLAEQYKAHRKGNMERVWVIRRLRSRIQIAALSVMGQPLNDDEALKELLLERDEVLEEMAQARHGLRLKRLAELRRSLTIINEFIVYWESK